MKSEIRKLAEEDPEGVRRLITRLKRKKTNEALAKELGLASTRSLNALLTLVGMVHQPVRLTESDLLLSALQLAKKYKISRSYATRLRKEYGAGTRRD